MGVALTNGRVLLPGGFSDDVCVVVENGRIASVSSQVPGDAEEIDLGGKRLLPGFIDVQVNGGGGLLFNDDPSVETIRTMAEAHRRFGTTGLLPTLISDDLSIVERGIVAVDEAIEAGVPGVLGIHIEGPFLSSARRGIHLESKLQKFEDRFVELLSSGRRGKTVVTIAPECASPSQIKRLADAGLIICAGHSDADYDTVRAGIDAGISGFTHLFNAMSQLRNRAPGMVGAALEDRTAYAGIIVDGHHIHPGSFRVALAAKGIERLMLVTDAMATIGSDSDEFMLQGRRIRLQQDRLVSDENVLAGSSLSMNEAVANAAEQGRLSVADAVYMATSTPAHFLGLESVTGSITAGHRADLVLVEDDFTVAETWIAGEPSRASNTVVSASS